MTAPQLIMTRLRQGPADVRDLARILRDGGFQKPQAVLRDTLETLTNAKQITEHKNGAISLFINPAPSKKKRTPTAPPVSALTTPTGQRLVKRGGKWAIAP